MRNYDIVLVGAGIMSATLAMLLKSLDAKLNILMVEKLPNIAGESSDAWNNAGTGHAAYCELNYTPETKGHIEIARAANINAAFETSLQFWSYLVKHLEIPHPETFINRVPHISFVWGEQDVDFLRRRHAMMTQHHLFADMAYTENIDTIESWAPLLFKGRTQGGTMAATRVEYGTDVDFGMLSRHMVNAMKQRDCFDLLTETEVYSLRQQRDSSWQIGLLQRNGQRADVQTKRVFIGAGGASLSLLQKSGVAESKAYGGFPVSGLWLACKDDYIIKQHHTKVYGKAPLGAPPMSVPHLDTRIINGKPALLFGPYAGFTTKFLKQGSMFDLLGSVKASNFTSLMAAGAKNVDLTRYLMAQAVQSPSQRLQALKAFYPAAQLKDWELVTAGQRVQVIKHGKLEFGTEMIVSKDNTLAALLGASPGASVSVAAMLQVIERCFADKMETSAWQQALKKMIPAYGKSVQDDAALASKIRRQNLKTLGLQT